MKNWLSKRAPREVPGLAGGRRWIVVLTVTLLALVAVAVYADFSAMIAALSRASIPVFILATLVFWINYFVRTVRFSLVLEGARPGYALFRGVSLHGAAAYFVPLRLGEISFPWLVASSHKGSKLDAFRALLLVRSLDLFFLGFILGLVFVFDVEAVIMVCRKAECLGALSRFFELHGVLSGIVIIAASVSGAVVSWKFFAKSRQWPFWILTATAGVWLLVAFFFMLISRAVGEELSVVTIALLLVLTAFAQMLPFQGLASTGTHEIAWTLVYLVEGYKLDNALGMALATHILIALSVASLMLVVFFSGKNRERPLRGS